MIIWFKNEILASSDNISVLERQSERLADRIRFFLTCLILYPSAYVDLRSRSGLKHTAGLKDRILYGHIVNKGIRARKGHFAIYGYCSYILDIMYA